MSRARWSLAVVAMIAVAIAACSNAGAGSGTGGGGNTAATNHDQAVKFAECMRSNGVSQFPDPDASGAFTIDSVINGSSLDPNSAAFTRALSACKNLEPPGFTGAKRRPAQQKAALQFAQCMRDNGVNDFPDPAPDGPIIAVNGAHSIPGFFAARDKCGAIYGQAMGVSGQ